MTRRTSVVAAEPLDERVVRITFADGEIHEVDLAPILAAGGVFAQMRDERHVFEQVRIDPEFGTLEWPGGIDLDPDVVRGDREPASGRALPRRVVQPS